MIEDPHRPSELERAWESHARAALQWRAGEPIASVLEALALSVALEAIGALADASRVLREDLLRVGRRALLQGGAERSTSDAASPEDEDAAEAHAIAISLARDGLRALAGREPDAPEESTRPPPSPRDLARLLSGRADPFEAATIARALRGSSEARAEIEWALGRSHRAVGKPRVLAAADGDVMRDPAAGEQIATVCDPRSGAIVVELYAFSGGGLAAYAREDAALRVEGPGVRTEAMQPGYWAGALEVDVAREDLALVVHLGDERHVVRVSGR